MGDIVIGSGPAGVSAAEALIARGREVTLLDTGVQMEADAVALRSRLGSVEPAEWSDANWAPVLRPSGASARASSQDEQSDLMRPFGSGFLFHDPVDLFGPSGPPAGIDLRPSFATGGLSNGWGASVLPYRDEDIADWPIDANDLAPHYSAVRGFMPMAARDDDLAALFPALSIDHDSSLPSSSQAKALLQRLDGEREKLGRSGIHFGKSRVAVSSTTCRRCRMCLHGCPYRLIFDASMPLDVMLAERRIDYRRGCFVTRFEENDHGVVVRGRSLTGGGPFEVTGDRLFIGCGVLPTARLVLSSLGRFDAKIVLKDSQHFYLPLLQGWSPRPDPADESLHTLTQLFLEIVDPAVDRHTVHVQLYTHNDFYASDMRKRLGPLAGLASPLIGGLSRRLIVAQTFLHSDVSPAMRVSLVASPEGDERLKVEPGDPVDAGPTIRRVRRRLSKALRGAGLHALTPLSRLGGLGSSFHCGGSFPMRADPTGLESDVLGRPAGLKRVHVVDASVFPSIPATTITLSVMANAHRIASEATRLGARL